MSPTIPPVLVLSLVLVPPPAEAGEMMDSFAQIRETLKYWRRIYNMYHEEVTLGYCWAEYFLGLGEGMKDAPTSRHVSLDPSNPRSTRSVDSVVEDTEERSLLSLAARQELIRPKRSYGASKFTDAGMEEISKISEKNAKPCERRHSVRGSIDLAEREGEEGKIRGGCNLKSIDCDVPVFRGSQGRNGELSVDVDRVRKPSSLLSSLKVSEGEQRANRDGRLLGRKGKKIVESLFDPEFKGSGAEGDRGVKGKSKGLEVDTRRKVLYTKTNRATSGRSSRRTFLLKVPAPRERQRSLGARLYSLRGVASLNDSRFIGGDMTERLDDNNGRGDFRRGRKFNSSNPDSQRERRSRMFEGSYQRDLRRARGMDYQIKSHPLLPSSKYAKASFYIFAPFDKFSRLVSPRYPTPTDWNTEIGEKMGKLRNIRRSSAGKPEAYSPIYYSERYPNIHQANKPPWSVSTGRKTLPVILKGIHNDSSSFMSNPRLVRSSFNISNENILLKCPTGVRGMRRKNNWGAGDGSKHLLTVNNNRYQRARLSVLLEKSVPEEAGRKKPTRYPVGRPSLLPVSNRRFMGDYGNMTTGTTRYSKPSRSSRAKEQGRSSKSTSQTRGLAKGLAMLFNIPAAFMTFLRNLGYFVQVGRQIMDYVESNAALACTKDYLWGKVVQWIDS